MRTRLPLALAPAVLLAALIGPAAALPPPPPGPAAAPSDAVAARAGEQRQALAAADRQGSEANRRSLALHQRAATMRAGADRDRAEIAALALSLQAAEADLVAARARLALVDAAQAQARAALAAQQRPVLELLASLQMLSRQPPVSVFARPGTTGDIIHARALMDSILPEIRRRTWALRAQVDRGRALAAQQRQATQALAAGNARLAQRRLALARSEADQRLKAEQFASTAGLEEDRAAALSDEAQDIGALLGRLEADATVRDRLAMLPGPTPRPGSVADSATRTAMPAAGGGRPAYRLPVIGRLERGFGELGADGTRARGITIATAAGAQVVAPAAGRIVFAGPFRSYGRIVIIDHGGGWTSVITDLLTLTAGAGDRVEQGTPLGRTGPMRPRVTIELRRAGQPIDIATLAS